MTRPYPAHWEADVVLSDGRTAHLRPIRPDDAQRLVRFYESVSQEAKYFRFFAPHPQLSEREVAHFTTVDYDDRVAILATLGEDILGLVRYDRLDGDDRSDPATPEADQGQRPTTAEVAFLVTDAHQGRGLGTVLLEHLAAAARERGIERFVAEVLVGNRKMIQLFQELGYSVHSEVEAGVIRLGFDLAETETSLAVRAAREHRAEARSTQQLLNPRSVVVIGASRRPRSLGHTVLRNLREGGFAGSLAAVHPQVDEIAGVPAYRTVGDVPGDIDLAVVAVPAAAVEQVVAECATKAVRALVVVSAGFAETGEEGRARQQRLVHLARASGMRVVGPNSYGLINADPALRLNASLAPALPRSGRLGIFTQSAALGVSLLDGARRRGLGLSTFVSAGNRADVSGNDLLQHWEDDQGTGAVLLYLESIGNPRKFNRLARRAAGRKPVVAVRTGHGTQGVPLGHSVRSSAAPLAAVDALFRQAGVIRVDDVHQLLDVGQVLACQPLPAGPRVAVVANSEALGRLAADSATRLGLDVVDAADALPPDAGPTQIETALSGALADPGVDSVVVVFTPALQVPDDEVVALVDRHAASATKTLVVAFIGMPVAQAAAQEPVPASAGPMSPSRAASFPTPEDAVRALAAVTGYVAWRNRPQGQLPEITGLHPQAAHLLVEKLLADLPSDAVRRELTPGETAELLGHYGVAVWPAEVVRSPEDAVAAAEQLGFPVVLKATLPHLRHRPELGQVRMDLPDAGQVRGAYAGLIDAVGPEAIGHVVVQRQAPTGVAVLVESMEDPLFGPILSFGVAGLATELLDDRVYAIPPLTDTDVAALVRAPRAAPLLFGHRGARSVDTAALQDLLLRLSRLADDLPEVARLELNPVLVTPKGLHVLGAAGQLAHPLVRTDRALRALPG